MMDINSLLAAASGTPHWIVGVVVAVGAVATAVIAQTLISAGLDRVFGRRHPIVHSLVVRTRGIIRYALSMLALAAAIPLVPLSANVADILQHVLVAAFVLFLGWLAVDAIELLADTYVGRFRLDATDNLMARRAVTQVRVLKRVVEGVVILCAIGFALMTFNSVRQYGVSLFASAGVAGLVAGLAARPVLSNFIAGIQLAITQPITLEDVVIIEGEWGTIEEITASYVVVKIWDLRRLIVPISYFFEKPFQNWTRTSAALIGIVYLYTDYTVPVEKIRTKLHDIVKESPLWDGVILSLQVTDASPETLQLRAIVGTRNSSDAWNLRCEVREKLITYLQSEFPDALPRRRAEIALNREGAPAGADS